MGRHPRCAATPTMPSADGTPLNRAKSLRAGRSAPATSNRPSTHWFSTSFWLNFKVGVRRERQQAHQHARGRQKLLILPPALLEILFPLLLAHPAKRNGIVRRDLARRTLNIGIRQGLIVDQKFDRPTRPEGEQFFIEAVRKGAEHPDATKWTPEFRDTIKGGLA